MAKVIENYIRLTVKDCKRLGYFRPNADTSGVIRWTQGGNTVASVGFRTNLLGTVPFAVLTYNYEGSPVRTNITLRFKPSNLKEGTGYYYFVCPVTGLSCRNLYLVGGEFISRVAFRPLYRQQTETHSKSNVSLDAVRALTKYEDLVTAKYRRLTYRGNLTPYGRKVEKYERRARAITNFAWHRAETKGWSSI